MIPREKGPGNGGLGNRREDFSERQEGFWRPERQMCIRDRHTVPRSTERPSPCPARTKPAIPSTAGIKQRSLQCLLKDVYKRQPIQDPLDSIVRKPEQSMSARWTSPSPVSYTHLSYSSFKRFPPLSGINYIICIMSLSLRQSTCVYR